MNVDVEPLPSAAFWPTSVAGALLIAGCRLADAVEHRRRQDATIGGGGAVALRIFVVLAAADVEVMRRFKLEIFAVGAQKAGERL